MRASLTLAFVCALACGAPATPVETAAPETPPLGALTSLTPGSSTFVLVAHPRDLLAAPSTARVALALLDERRLEAFGARTGVDPRELAELILAIHPEGRVVLARGSFDARFAVAEAGERMAPLESSVDAPWPRRAGFLGERRIEMIALDDGVLAWIDGSPQLAARLLRARGQAPGDRMHAFREHEATELLNALREAPFALHSPQPLGLATDSGLGMLLARERALAFAVDPLDETTLRLRAELRGEFPEGASENFVAFAHSIAASELGAAVGARDALPTLRVESAERAVSGSATLPAASLASGLRAVLFADMEELIEGRRPPPLPRPPSSTPEPSPTAPSPGEPPPETDASTEAATPAGPSSPPEPDDEAPPGV